MQVITSDLRSDFAKPNMGIGQIAKVLKVFGHRLTSEADG